MLVVCWLMATQEPHGTFWVGWLGVFNTLANQPRWPWCCAVEKDRGKECLEMRLLGVLANTVCIFSIKIILPANSTGIFDPVCFCSLTKHFGPGIRRAKAYSRA